MKLIQTSIVLILFLIVNGDKLKLLKFEKCDPNVEYTVDVNSKIVEENGRQYVEEAWMKTPIPLGHNVKLSIDISVFEDDQYNHLITIEEDYCDAIYNNHSTDMVFEIQKIVGIEPGSCPIPAGEYRIHKYPLDFDKIKPDEELFEQGQLKAVFNFIDTASQSNLICMVTEILQIKDE